MEVLSDIQEVSNEGTEGGQEETAEEVEKEKGEEGKEEEGGGEGGGGGGGGGSPDADEEDPPQEKDVGQLRRKQQQHPSSVQRQRELVWETFKQSGFHGTDLLIISVCLFIHLFYSVIHVFTYLFFL